MNDDPVQTGAGFWLVRRLLDRYPEDFRRAYAEEVYDLIEVERDRLASRGRIARVFFWPRTLLDTFRTGLRLRRLHRESRAVQSTSNTHAGVELMHSLFCDLRYAIRALRSSPVASFVVILTLGLGIGMNTAIFSAVNAVLFRPLPYDDPASLVSVSARYVNDDVETASFAGRDLVAMREQSVGFEGLAAVIPVRQNLTGSENPEQVQVAWVTTNILDVLGVQAAVGRGFRGDDPPGTALVSHELWQRAFGGEDVLGSTVQLDGFPYNVVGVLPAGFKLHHRLLPEQFDVWKVPDDWWQNGDVWGAQGVEYGMLRGVGRLAPGTGLEAAQVSLGHVAASLRQQEASYATAGLEFVVEPLHDGVVRDVRATLWMLLAAVVFVLLIACANVMNLMLVRAQGRTHEIALRLALGCNRRRIAQLLLTESLVLAVLGGGLGLLLGVGGIELLKTLQLQGVPRLDGLFVDGTVLAFTAVVCVLCTVLFGLVPAVSAGRRTTDERLVLSRTTPGHRRQRLSRVLVIGQIALSLVLLVGAGLLTASLVALNDIKPGFEYRQLLTFTVSMPGTRYERPVGTDAFLRRLEERIGGLPGVSAVGVVWPMPLTGRSWSNAYVAGSVLEGDRAYAGYRVGTPTMFEALGMEMLDGETFGTRDPKRVIIVSQNVAERAWPGQRAIGKTVTANPWGGGFEPFEVIGVVSNVRFGDLREPPGETLYFDSRGWSWTDWEMNFAVRAAVTPDVLIPAIRAELYDMDEEIPMAGAQPMSFHVNLRTASNRFALTLIGSFATIALVLAGIGLYGVLSYSVNQRRRELGIRMALGSEQTGIMVLVLKQGILLTTVGIVLGLGGAVMLTRFLSSFLFNITPTDLATYSAVTGLLFVIGVVACFVPAKRATHVDTMQVLRSE